MKHSRIAAALIIFSAITASWAQQKTQVPFAPYLHHPWVDSVLNTLSEDERIAQLIVVAAFSNSDDAHKKEILKLIREQKVGGLIFFQGGPVRETKLINEYQSVSKVPLLMAIDAEWGFGMRLDSTISFPYQMTLGAIQDDSLIYKMGVAVAGQLKRAGLQVNFAPVVDVNNNPTNPVINFRSFGEERDNVARKAIAYMKGMQDNGILTTAKHFPGHGDTGTDSHYTLPLIVHGRERLDSLELHPFRQIINAGIAGVMVAHLNVPALDSSNVPSTLSRKIVTDLLRNELGFTGLIVTDAMNMKGVSTANAPGIVDRDAILAGNDMLEFTEDVSRTIVEIRNAIKEKKISQRDIDDRCRKLLAIKYWVGLHDRQDIQVRNIVKDLNTPVDQLLNRNLLQAAITVLRNEGNLMPLRALGKIRLASVSFGRDDISAYQRMLERYMRVDHFVVSKDASQFYLDSLATLLGGYSHIVAGIHDEPGRPRNQVSFSEPVLNFIRSLSAREQTIVAVFKNPYSLTRFEGIDRADGLIVTYQDNDDVEELTAQLVFGGIGATGRLPVSVGEIFASGDGLDVEGGIRFKYTLPEDAGMDSEILNRKVDSLVHQAMLLKAIPGCQVLVAKNRKVVLSRAYGYHDYSDTVRVKPEDLYDLASVTKISTGLPALMKLYDEGNFTLEATLADYLPKFRRSNKSGIPMYDILTHQARFRPWIPFYQELTKKDGNYKWFTVKSDSSRRFPVRLKDNMFLHRRFPDRIVNEIRKSPLEVEKKYLYSDFFFILAPRVVESMIDVDFQTYIRANFYAPLGASSLTYNPYLKYPLKSIVPTEYDFYFRHQPIHGTVHDEGAIMMGGVSGHAGLFGNANDLAKLMQMYLDMGTYGGDRYISSKTLLKWTATQFPESNNRRGLGFDKPNLSYSGPGNNTAIDASPASFGHTGFTGTFSWMDPDSGLLYIFLSNRVNPTRNNTRLYHLNTRTQIQQVLYDAIEAYEEKDKGTGTK